MLLEKQKHKKKETTKNIKKTILTKECVYFSPSLLSIDSKKKIKQKKLQ